MTKVVILCGGEGTRLREETESRPKPLVEVGGMPILWHIMKIYAHYGYRDFILCLGYKGEMIKRFFREYEWKHADFTMNLRKKEETFHHVQEIEDWNVTFVETGEKTATAGRVRAAAEHIDTPDFMLTYADGVADIDIKALHEFHRKHGKLVTITGFRPRNKFGVIKMDGVDALEFVEKPPMQDVINAGFMVLKREALAHFDDGMLEQTVLPPLAGKRQVAVRVHEGVWQEMDTYKDWLDLNRMWRESAPWKVWK